MDYPVAALFVFTHRSERPGQMSLLQRLAARPRAEPGPGAFVAIAWDTA